LTTRLRLAPTTTTPILLNVSSTLPAWRSEVGSRWCSLTWLKAGAYRNEEADEAGERDEEREGRRVYKEPPRVCPDRWATSV
jgi:hypothetical protein